ncbi:MAG: hypothetical protein GFH25_541210n30 [Chloroflexi bacterium AL-N10]|nr:hypothetical protein [Chloroflexi bacterium AL-N1]NOK69603.1 hypothetical protein [Chloroflexi bacterium AL-N10]NOK72150.1 hypothetical protein [Chloroflexi bacterium AL-N5]
MVSLGQFVGLSGIGEFLLDMYVFTDEFAYLFHAQSLETHLDLFAVKRPEGWVFPGEELLRLIDDYAPLTTAEGPLVL